MGATYNHCAWVAITKRKGVILLLAELIADELRLSSPDPSLLDLLNKRLKEEQGRVHIKSPLVPPDTGGGKYIEASKTVDISDPNAPRIGMFPSDEFYCRYSPLFIGAGCDVTARAWFDKPPNDDAIAFVTYAKAAHAYILVGFAP